MDLTSLSKPLSECTEEELIEMLRETRRARRVPTKKTVKRVVKKAKAAPPPVDTLPQDELAELLKQMENLV